MIDDGLSFRLVPWRPALEQNLGQQLADTMTPGGLAPKDYVPKALRSGELEMSCHDPDDPANWPRNMFVWRSNLLGSSGKGHEYFLKHLLGTSNGVLGKDLGVEGREKPQEVAWHDKAPEGKLDLLVTLDFHMSTTCVYSDIVLPTATCTKRTTSTRPTCTRSANAVVSSVGSLKIFAALATDVALLMTWDASCERNVRS